MFHVCLLDNATFLAIHYRIRENQIIEWRVIPDHTNWDASSIIQNQGYRRLALSGVISCFTSCKVISKAIQHGEKLYHIIMWYGHNACHMAHTYQMLYHVI